MTKKHAIGQLPTASQMKEFWGQVNSGLITKERLQKFLEEKKVCPFPQETSHLRLIGETTISATKAGTGMDQKNKYPFDWVDNYFDNWDAQTVSKDTKEAKAFVYEQMQNGTYADIFGSFNKNLDVLEFETHEQIKDFVKNSPELLHPKGYTTHFLYKNKSGKHFVACVRRSSGGDLNVSVFEFSYDFVWHADPARRFVILATKTLEPKS